MRVCNASLINMGCPKCGKPTVPGAAFCMHCGQALTPAPTAASKAKPAPKSAAKVAPAAAAKAGARAAAGAAGAAAVMAPSGVMSQAAFKARQDLTRRRAIIGTTSGLITLLLCAVLVKASGILSAGQHRVSANDLSVQGASSDTILKEKGVDDASMLKSGAPLIGMPDDVRDWLKHLQEVERRKRELTGNEMREAQLMLGQANATDGIMTGEDVKSLADPDSNVMVPPVVTHLQDMVTRFKQKWYDLSEFLRSKPAPAECKPIEESYDKGLNQLGMAIADIGDMFGPVLDKAESDPGAAKQEGLDKANEIKNSNSKNVDQNFGDADDGVGAICSKYHVSKMFDIDRNGGGGATMTAGG